MRGLAGAQLAGLWLAAAQFWRWTGAGGFATESTPRGLTGRVTSDHTFVVARVGLPHQGHIGHAFVLRSAKHVPDTKPT